MSDTTLTLFTYKVNVMSSIEFFKKLLIWEDVYVTTRPEGSIKDFKRGVTYVSKKNNRRLGPH